MRRFATVVSALLLGLALTTPAIAQGGGMGGNPPTSLRGTGTPNTIPKFIETDVVGDSIILENVGGIAVAGNVTATGLRR